MFGSRGHGFVIQPGEVPQGLNAMNGADIAGTDHRDQPLEAWTLDAPDPERPRSSSIAFTDAKARHACGPGQVVLPSLAFEIGDDLRHGRLPYIDDRRAGEVIRRDLGALQRRPVVPPRPVPSSLARGFEQ